MWSRPDEAPRRQARPPRTEAEADAATPASTEPAVEADGEEDVMNDSRSFWVDAQDDSAPSVTTAPAWGYDTRTCDACGSAWALTGCSRRGCTSISVTTRTVPPVPFMSRLSALVAPKPAPPRASAAQVEHICALRAGVTALLADLRSLDEQLRAAVIADVAELQPLQGLLNRALARTGDRGLASVDGLGLSLESFAAYVDIYVKQIGDTP
jgi:hypothetical protein